MAVCKIDWDDDNVGWAYCPSVAAAIAFCILYGITMLVHIFQAYTFRKKFCWVIIMSCIWETAGFAVRVYSTKQFRGLGHFIPQQLLIILAPIWLNAFVYMVLGRMIYFYIPEKAVFGVSARRLTLLFVALDIIAFLVQGSSSSLMSSDDYEVVRIGINIYMGGLGLQEFFILLFFVLAGRFQYKMTQRERVERIAYPWRRLLYALYAGLVLITIRIIFRLAEYSGGIHSALATSEAAFYVLEAAPMFISFIMFNVIHPGIALVGPESEFPKKKKKKEEKKSKDNASDNDEGGKDRKKKDKKGKKGKKGSRRDTGLLDLESGTEHENEGFQMVDRGDQADAVYMRPYP
ncbi:hypothetical protein AJ80_00920 [Polytolypa hystricis UAMH7299]|uniref:RTA1 domain-containing protein n=1 Tax=Polytolypa hystricis (strain UAMH7299) TaxID=1447883 RepID=A0A2B7Z311_POLH7|nr:hypothetical protein AJ80_00920 [Polytolypa hystricis UAMH7299]